MNDRVDIHEAAMNQVERRVVSPFILNVINLKLHIGWNSVQINELFSLRARFSHLQGRLCGTQINTDDLASREHCVSVDRDLLLHT